MSMVRTAVTTGLILLAAAPVLRAQDVEPDSALAAAVAVAVEPGIRAALRDGRRVSFEHRTPWGEAVKESLEASLGLSLDAGHERGASRLLLGAPEFDTDRALVEVWFGRCEPHGDTEILKVRAYSYLFRRSGEEWVLRRAFRLGTTEGSCEGGWDMPPPVQA
jgi:hypothetical protein